MLQNWRLSQSEALQEERANIFFIFISLWVFAEKAEWQQVHSVGDLQPSDTNSFCLQLNFSWEEPEVTAFLSIIAVHCHQSVSEKQSGRGGWVEGPGCESIRLLQVSIHSKTARMNSSPFPAHIGFLHACSHKSPDTCPPAQSSHCRGGGEPFHLLCCRTRRCSQNHIR